MNGFMDELFRTSVDDTAEFAAICEKIMRRAYKEGYMLFVPTPNKVFAVNKEVVFQPYKLACLLTNINSTFKRVESVYETAKEFRVSAQEISTPLNVLRQLTYERHHWHDGIGTRHGFNPRAT